MCRVALPILMQSSAKLAELLVLKETDPDKYWKQVEYFNVNYAGSGRNKFQMQNVSVSEYIRFLERHRKVFLNLDEASVCGRRAGKWSGERREAFSETKPERNAAAEPQTEASR
jgi:hypothetical protein